MRTLALALLLGLGVMVGCSEPAKKPAKDTGKTSAAAPKGEDKKAGEAPKTEEKKDAPKTEEKKDAK